MQNGGEQTRTKESLAGLGFGMRFRDSTRLDSV